MTSTPPVTVRSHSRHIRARTQGVRRKPRRANARSQHRGRRGPAAPDRFLPEACRSGPPALGLARGDPREESVKAVLRTTRPGFLIGRDAFTISDKYATFREGVAR
jgi:hypothetical protein